MNDTQVHSKEIYGKELGSPSQDRNGRMLLLQVIRLDTQAHWKEIHGKELGSPSQDRNEHMYILKLFLHHNSPVDGTRPW
jgi:hypothetical protein